jgi:hypothetical protein
MLAVYLISKDSKLVSAVFTHHTSEISAGSLVQAIGFEFSGILALFLNFLNMCFLSLHLLVDLHIELEEVIDRVLAKFFFTSVQLKGER